MQTKTELNIKSIANKLFFNHSRIFARRRVKLDMRYKANKAIYNECLSIESKVNMPMILKKIKIRRSLRYQYNNILNNALFNDYMNNKSGIKEIKENMIVFYSRNHWAKNQSDLKVLQVLKKHFYN